jgi:hypothetical protein
MKFSGGGKQGRVKILSPQPPSFLPARAFSLVREARRQFCSKKVRICQTNAPELNFYIFVNQVYGVHIESLREKGKELKGIIVDFA